MSCLFCNFPEPNYKPESHIDFICGRCVIILADADQADLKRAYDKVVLEGYENKVKAIKLFLIPEVMDGKRPISKPVPGKSIERRVNRKGIARYVRV